MSTRQSQNATPDDPLEILRKTQRDLATLEKWLEYKPGAITIVRRLRRRATALQELLKLDAPH